MLRDRPLHTPMVSADVLVPALLRNPVAPDEAHGESDAAPTPTMDLQSGSGRVVGRGLIKFHCRVGLPMLAR
ncbi:hypothetical protein BHE90_009059 [Fusarium euwallaceae]|uniref:Uncharacterized protein n=2 Tax=Fusarium solani species complex TaxID=232080 RepID=A0A428T7Z4_9HYPO|nr:hypothetical protein CEP52_010521 [Fusarium oligoseptatum]RTE76478.1 hypothetical protein BHE90_009059 [Fusarium euwallaceae]